MNAVSVESLTREERIALIKSERALRLRYYALKGDCDYSIYTPQESGVFFLEGEITPLIKIGFTTNPARYFAKIKEWSSDIYACIHFIPSEKNVLAPTMPLYMALELHRVSGRWYNIADSLLALMQKCETVEELEKLLVN